MTDEQEYAYWLEQQEGESDEELDAALVALYGECARPMST